jgi:tetratricopeptide (TPR) repeat protein
MLWLSLILSADAAKLPEIGLVGVHVDGLSTEDGEAASQRIGEALEMTGKVEWVEPQAVSGRLRGRESLVLEDWALKEGRAALEEGRLLYERAEPDAAIPVLDGAVDDLLAGVSITGQTDSLIEAYLVLGLAHTGMGQADEATEAFAQAAVLDPTRELDPISYPPDVIASYATVRDQVVARGSGGLEIRGEDGASVLIDGRDAGVLPLSVSDLTIGTHYVLVEADGGRRDFHTVVIQADQRAKVLADLSDRSLGEPASTGRGRAQQTKQLYSALGSYAQTDLILIAGSVDSEVAVALYSTRTGNFSRAMKAPGGSDPVQSIVDLVPAVGSFVTETGDIRPDAVAISVPALDIASNAVLTQLLLDPRDDVPIQVIEDGPRWGAIASGVGALAAVGAGFGVWYALRDSGEPTDQGTIVFGPIP